MRRNVRCQPRDTMSMNADITSASIAARIRGIIGGQDGGVVEATARRLGVSELSLRMSIDELTPHTVLDVVVAVVKHYGVDPTWLLTGEYDANTHRAVLDTEIELSR